MPIETKPIEFKINNDLLERNFPRSFGQARKEFFQFLQLPADVIRSIGHLHNDIILLIRPESFGVLLSCQIRAFVIQRDSGRSSKLTPS